MSALLVKVPLKPEITTEDFSKSFAATFDLRVILDYVLEKNPELIDQLPAIELQYRQFMFLISTKKFPGMSVPSHSVDMIWHAHILHTQLYSEFCQDLVGEFVHHGPYSKDVTQEQKSKSWNTLLDAYNQVFGLNFDLVSQAGCLFGSDTCNTTCDPNVCNLDDGGPSCGKTCTIP